MKKSVILKVGPAVAEIVMDEKILISDDLKRVLKNFTVNEKPEAKVILKVDSSLGAPNCDEFGISKNMFEIKGHELITHSSFMRASYNIEKKEGIAYFPGGDMWSVWVILVYMRIVFAILLLGHNCLLIHASGLVKNKKGYIFAGTNASGKSTIAQKAQTEGMQILGDDCIGIDVNRRSLFSTPFKKEIELLEADFYECLFIEQGGKFSKKAISEKDAVYLLMKNNHLFMYMRQKSASFMGKIIKLSALAMNGTHSYMLKSRLNDDIKIMI